MINTNKLLRTAISLSSTLYHVLLKGRIWYRQLFRIDHEKDIDLVSSILSTQVKIAIDIGANRGDFTQSLLWRNCKVISIEPDKMTFNILKNRFASNPNVDVYNFGCGSKNTTMLLYTPWYKKYPISGISSTDKAYVVDINNQFKALKPFYFFDAKKLTIKSKSIMIRTLDSLNLNPDFIKIDTEGTELDILKGGLKTISRNKPLLYIETPNAELISFLSTIGYEISIRGSNNMLFKSK